MAGDPEVPGDQGGSTAEGSGRVGPPAPARAREREREPEPDREREREPVPEPAREPEPVPWLDEDQQRAWRAVQVMQARLNASLASQLAADSDLSYPDYVVLVVLTEAPRGARVFELARALGWERSRVSHQIGRMEARGFVRRELCPSDRRGSLVVVTARGRRAIEDAAPGHVRAVRRLFVDVLTPAQLAALAEAANQVVEAVDHPE